MRDYVERYAVYLAQRGYSQRTIKEYSQYITSFYMWIRDNHAKIHPKNVTKEHIYAFQEHLFNLTSRRGGNIVLSTQGKRLRAIKSFFKFLSKRDYILFDPTTGLEMPKEEKSLPRDILTKPEIKRLLNRPDTTYNLGLRDKAMLELFYSTGIRLSELINIKMIDIDLERALFRVKGKF